MTPKQISEIREQAIRFTMNVLLHADDWQDGQTALAENERFFEWLDAGGDFFAEAQSIIRAAEKRLGGRLPY
jgi:hypothetical protein